ncbi:MAG: hypothetical protein KAS32_11190 [Candidatus Peribacteraceae bacterium]|nr:hypothetical protein [Candidatus Peribacteraceae bacterium]
MGFWFTFFIWVALFAAAQLLTPEPKMEDVRAPNLNDFKFPTATEGRIIPLVWGTDKVNAPNVMWYGDYAAYPIKEKVKVNMFNSKNFIKGYQFYIGFQMGICVGPAILRKIWVGDTLV